MKILLTTIVDNINYGTYLQSYATVKLLNDFGHNVDVLNYIRPHLSNLNIFKDSLNGNFFKIIISLINACLHSLMRRNLKRFLTHRANLTSKFNNWDKFRQKLEQYDLYLTGSDQVWNTIHNHGIDSTYFFGGINGKKCSYAASIGMDSYPDSDISAIKQFLDSYSMISVRECFGIDALKNIGINKDIVQVIDPTLMLNSNDWDSSIKSKFHKKEPYLLVYSVEVKRDKEVIEIARHIANKRNLKVYLVSPYVKFRSKINVDRVFSLAKTETFLSLFSQADFAVVSSFHGTAFAINYNCQFVTVSPDRFSSRVESLLNLLNLNNRYIHNVGEIPNTEIDYNSVNNILALERQRSSDILSQILSI